jgi:sporulation protein YlmC with PRC-barrel domain
MNAGAQIAYLVVDFDDAAENGDKQTLIPFTAFTPLSTETALEDCRFVFAGDYSLDGVPVFDLDNLPDVDVNDWDNEIASFWNNLGVYVGAGADESAALGNPVVLRAEFQDINVTNAAGDDLGEVEDFVINPESGVLTHAVLETGGFLGIGNKRIPVPMNRVVWGDFDDDNADLGEMVINIADDAWENAPVVDDLDDIDFGNPDWDVDFDTYWEGIK